MKKLFLVLIFSIIAFSAYCGGLTDMNLVNEQEIELNGIHTIHLSYEDGSITVLKSNTSSLIVKEYMNQDKRSYFAGIHTAGDTVNIESGERPLISLGINELRTRIELYVPESFAENLDVRTNNGGISIDSVNGIIIAATSNGSIDLNHVDGMVDASTSNGSIDIDSVKGNVNAQTSNASIKLQNIDGTVEAKTNNGSIHIDSVNGNVAAENSNGSIALSNVDGTVDARTSNSSVTIDSVKGMIDAETSNGRIECSLSEVTGNVKLETSNGSIDLDIPRSLSFQFSARTTLGRVRTAFDDKLSRPVNDDVLYQGTVGEENNPDREIILETQNGSISVDWAD